MTTRCERSVPPSGDPASMLRFIGEAPGAEEAAASTPFVGPAGEELWRCAAAVGIDRSDVYVANTVCDRPENNDYSKVSAEAVAHCQREHVAPPPAGSVTVLLGAHALALADPFAAKRPTRWRGSLFVHRGALAVAALHPSYIMRGNWALRPLLMGDLHAAASLAGTRDDAAAVVGVPRIGTCAAGPTLALDIETTKRDDIDFLGLTTDGVTVEHVQATQTMWQQRVQHFVDAATTVLAHNAKFDVTRLERVGVRFDRSKIVDTQLAQAMIASDLETGLDDTAAFNLPGRQVWWKGLGDFGKRITPAEREHCRGVWGKIWPLTLESVRQRELCYNALDVAMTWRVWGVQKEVLGGR